jgi:hypothetical protein
MHNLFRYDLYLLLRITKTAIDPAPILEGSIVSLPPQDLVDRYNAAAEAEGQDRPFEFRDHVPLNPYFFHLPLADKVGHPGLYAGEPFPEIPLERDSWMEIQFAPNLAARIVQEQVPVKLTFTKFFKVKVKKNGQTTTETHGSRFIFEGPAVRCAKTRCGMSLAGNIQHQLGDPEAQ